MKVLAMKITTRAQISTSPFVVYLYMYLLFIKLKKQINKEIKNGKIKNGARNIMKQRG
jgi:hypothetical protein